MENEPLVSIIMNCYNGEKYLREAIDSAFSQTYKNWEIIFWDNLSIDNSAKIAKAYGEKLKYFKGEYFLSLGAARNEALKRSKGNYIAFLDVDDLWSPVKLETQIPHFTNTDISLVYTNVIYINKNGDYLSKARNTIKNSSQVKTFYELLVNYDLVMSSVIISRSSLNKQEWFDSKLEYAEEYDLFLRIVFSNNAFKVNDYLTYNRLHEDSVTHTKFYLLSEESSYVIDKIVKIWPEIENDNLPILRIVRDKIIGQKYLDYILTRNLKKARQIIAPIKYNNSKYFLFYLISFLGIKSVIFLWKSIRFVKKRGRILGL